MAEFEVYVSKADFKFNCAHFIIYNGFRERLHGHNYQVSAKVVGDGKLGEDGYLIDFGDIKKAMRSLCAALNEYFICPVNSPNLKIESIGELLCLQCDDGSSFSFPKSDCAMLPLYHSSAEELSHYFFCYIIRLGFVCLNFFCNSISNLITLFS
jgi:6-pyruvoyltetrahydropterin/6-carboxytetrahydropterin synthase